MFRCQPYSLSNFLIHGVDVNAEISTFLNAPHSYDIFDANIPSTALLQRYIVLWKDAVGVSSFGIGRLLSHPIFHPLLLCLVVSLNITASLTRLQAPGSRRIWSCFTSREESLLSALGNITFTMYVSAVCAQNKHRYLTRTHTCHIKAGEKSHDEIKGTAVYVQSMESILKPGHGDWGIVWKS